MIRNYKFYDKEATRPVIVTYEFDPPFYENLDEELKSQYGEDLTFVKEINHRDRIIRIHTAYDSGKGTLYVPPAKRKKRRTNLKKRIAQILEDKDSDFLEVKNEYDENLILIFDHKDVVEIFGPAYFKNGNVFGYRIAYIDNTLETIFRFLKRHKFYPYFHEYLK